MAPGLGRASKSVGRRGLQAFRLERSGGINGSLLSDTGSRKWARG